MKQKLKDLLNKENKNEIRLYCKDCKFEIIKQTNNIESRLKQII